eukprot:jgi/Tetstr1/423312/TSEL_014010.t1
MVQSPLGSPLTKDRADGDEERADRGMAISDGDAFWEGDDEEREPTGFLSSLNGSDKDETGGQEEGHEGEEERKPRLQGTVEGGAKEVRFFWKTIVGKCSKGPERAFAVEVVKQMRPEDFKLLFNDLLVSMRRDRGSVRGSAAAKNRTHRKMQWDAQSARRWASYVKYSHAKDTAVCHDDLDNGDGGAAEQPLSSAEDAEVKVGGPLNHARLCAFNNTEREAVQGMNVCTCLKDAEDSTDEGATKHVSCATGAERRATERAVVDNMKKAYVSVLAPSQLGVGISDADYVLIHGVRLIAEKLCPRAVIVLTDLHNAYNEA